MANATAGRRFRIVPDSDPQNPLDDERVGRFVFTERNRYFSGDKHKFDSDVGEEVRRSRPFLKLPVYAYVHSGVTIWTTGDNEPCIPGAHRGWDSGQAGWIIAEFASCLRAFGRGFTREQVARALRSEVQTYNQFLTGDVYGFEILEDCEECENEGCTDCPTGDSCWGFYGRDAAVEAAKNEIVGDAIEVK